MNMERIWGEYGQRRRKEKIIRPCSITEQGLKDKIAESNIFFILLSSFQTKFGNNGIQLVGKSG